MSTPDIQQQLARLEKYVVMLVQMTSPTMTMEEVGKVVGFKSRTSIRAWLKAKGIAPVGRRYSRAMVISAATQ